MISFITKYFKKSPQKSSCINRELELYFSRLLYSHNIKREIYTECVICEYNLRHILNYLQNNVCDIEQFDKLKSKAKNMLEFLSTNYIYMGKGFKDDIKKYYVVMDQIIDDWTIRQNITNIK